MTGKGPHGASIQISVTQKLEIEYEPGDEDTDFCCTKLTIKDANGNSVDASALIEFLGQLEKVDEIVYDKLVQEGDFDDHS